MCFTRIDNLCVPLFLYVHVFVTVFALEKGKQSLLVVYWRLRIMRMSLNEHSVRNVQADIRIHSLRKLSNCR